ncbi:MAG TPA: ABC transporter substrate-binding protein [Xanthobacteraceae bacterium]|nr:ABC transporter substrate-binding protein [Xanthobacteraceae bacterium]
MMKSILSKLALTAGLCVALAMPSSASAAEIKVGFSPSLPQIPLYIAAEKGFFKEEGLDVSLKPTVTATPKLLPLLAGGELDIVFGGASAALFNAMDGGIKFAMVADGGQVDPNFDGSPYVIIVRKDLYDAGSFKTLADLKGKTLSFAVEGTSLAYMMFKALKNAGLQPSDVTIRYFKALSDMGVAFQNKAVDASAMTVPLNLGLAKNGISVDWVDARQAAPGLQAYTLIYGEKLLTSRREEGKAFLRAYAKAIAWYKNALKGDKSELIQIGAKWTKLPVETLQNSIWTYFDDKLQMNVPDIKDQYQTWLEQKLVKGGLDVDSFIDTKLASEALQSK